MKRDRFNSLALIGLVLILAVALVAFGTSCTQEKAAASEKIGVAVTILPLADFVENVGGEKVDVTVMVPPGASPHSYEPTPSQMVGLSQAQTYVKVGSGVQFELAWMDKIIEQNPDMLVIDCSVGITKLGKDPHIWNSPVNARKMVENVYEGLVGLDPDNTNYYLENTNSYLQELNELDNYIHQRLDGFVNRNFMIYHPAFGYFAEEYNLNQLTIEHEGKSPTPKVIQDCVDLAEEHNLSYIFVAPQFATDDAEMIANEIDGEALFVDPLPRLYITNMRSVVGALALEME